MSQFIDLIWDKAVYEQHIDITQDKFADWYYIGWVQNAFGTLRVLTSILITYGLVKYLRVFIPQLDVMTLVLRKAVINSLGFAKFAVVGFLGFLMYFFLTVGPYSLPFSEMSFSLMSLMQLLVGRWRSPIDATEFISVWYLTIPLIFFAYCRTIVVLLQIVKFQHDLKLVMGSNTAITRKSNH